MSRLSKRGSSAAATYAARLARTPPFDALPEQERASLAAVAVKRSVKKGELLFRKGERPDAVAIVLTGELHVRERAHPREALLRAIRPDQVVGLSTIAGQAHSADVVAAEEGSVLLLHGVHLRSLLHPDLALSMVAHLADLLARATTEKLEERSLSLDDRLLLRLRQLTQPLQRREVNLTHADLAAHVGATRANVSRALARLEADGSIRRLGRKRIEVV